MIASQGNLYRPPSSNAGSPIDERYELSPVCQVKSSYCKFVRQVTNKIPNSPSQKRARHQLEVSLPYSSTALGSPSFPCRLGSSILIDCRSEDSLAVKNDTTCCWTGKKLINRRQRTSFAQHLETTADRLYNAM